MEIQYFMLHLRKLMGHEIHVVVLVVVVPLQVGS